MSPYSKLPESGSGSGRHQSRQQPKLSSNYDCQPRTAQHKVRSGQRRSPSRPFPQERDSSGNVSSSAADFRKSTNNNNNRFNGNHPVIPRVVANVPATKKTDRRFHREKGKEGTQKEEEEEEVSCSTDSRAVALYRRHQESTDLLNAVDGCYNHVKHLAENGNAIRGKNSNRTTTTTTTTTTSWSPSGSLPAASSAITSSFYARLSNDIDGGRNDVSPKFPHSRGQRCYYAADEMPSEVSMLTWSKSSGTTIANNENIADANRIPPWVVRALSIMAERANVDVALSEPPVNRLFAGLARYADSIWSSLLRIIIDYANSYHPFSYDQLTNIRSCYERFVNGTLTPYAIRSFSCGTAGNADWLMVILSFMAKNGPDIALGSNFVTSFLQMLAAQFPYGGYEFLQNLINRYQSLYRRPFTAEHVANIRRTFERFNKLSVDDADFGQKITTTVLARSDEELRKSPSLSGISNDLPENVETTRDFVTTTSSYSTAKPLPEIDLTPSKGIRSDGKLISPSALSLAARRSNFDSGQSSSGTTPSPIGADPNESCCKMYGSGNDYLSSSSGLAFFSPQTASPYW